MKTGTPILPPDLTFGLPVYNGARTLRRCLDSVLAQDHDSFEVVISDNASTDGTREIVEEYVARDSRIRAFYNDENQGQIENCNRVFHLGTGRYFRWIGVSDWIEPHYARRCVEALDRAEDAVAVTSYFKIHLDDDLEKYTEFEGERLESDDPVRRFRRMLWFFHAGDDLYDPLYGVMRRSALEKTAMLRMITKADFMLAAELSLLGRFCHVPECLAHRCKPADLPTDSLEIRKRYHPRLYNEIYTTAWQHLKILRSMVSESPLPAMARLQCRRAALRFALIEARNKTRARLTRFRREKLGLTRRNLSKIWPGKKGDTGRERGSTR